MGVANKKLKWGLFTSPQSGHTRFEQYVIENEKDLKAFAKYHDGAILKSQVGEFRNMLREGEIILANINALGYVSYRTESPKTDNHPSSFHRVKLGKNA